MTSRISDSTWKDILTHVRVHYPDLARGWFVRLSPEGLDSGVLSVNAVTHAQVGYLNDQCGRAFGEAAQAAIGRLISVQFETDAPPEEGLEPLSFEKPESYLQLIPDYMFSNFITGPCNRLAHAASVAVAKQLGTAYNPLFIHGEVGLGKTHLIQAICHEVREQKPDLNLMYLTCETFSNHFFEAVERGALHQFRYRYRHADLLIVDDVQFLADRDRSQEEFFHTFNTLFQSQRQIVLSADCSPGEIPSLEQRLISRFNSGLVACVDFPCLETRMAIIRTKAKLACIEMPEEVVLLIANRIQSNVREIEGALKRINLVSQERNDGRVNLAVAHEALGVSLPRAIVSVQEILNLVTKHYNVRLSDLQGKRRTKSIAFPRQVCMYLARELTSYSLEEIGGSFGGRDHTTVIHACKLIREKRTEDPEFDLHLEELTRTLVGVIHRPEERRPEGSTA